MTLENSKKLYINIIKLDNPKGLFDSKRRRSRHN